MASELGVAVNGVQQSHSLQLAALWESQSPAELGCRARTENCLTSPSELPITISSGSSIASPALTACSCITASAVLPCDCAAGGSKDAGAASSCGEVLASRCCAGASCEGEDADADVQVAVVASCAHAVAIAAAHVHTSISQVMSWHSTRGTGATCRRLPTGTWGQAASCLPGPGPAEWQQPSFHAAAAMRAHQRAG